MDLEGLRNAIVNANASWVAAETPIAQLVAGGDAKVFGLAISEPRRAELLARASELEEQSGLLADAGPPPIAFDWREQDRLTPIRSQGNCGSCVAFATCATLEARARIHRYMDAEFDLSEAHLFACGCGQCCRQGWDPELALGAAKRGIGREADFPYVPQDQPCPVIQSVLSVPNWTAYQTTDGRKQAIASNGPVMGGMRTFEDLAWYKSGIYQHVSGEQTENHMVCVVGYDDVGGYWIVKNSWGTSWGEEGYIRIKYGECGLGEDFAFYDPDIELIE